MSEAESAVENTTEEDLKEPTSDSGNKQNENVEGLSKRARKRLAKRQLWLDTKAERRQAEKAKKREKIARLKEVNAHFLGIFFFFLKKLILDQVSMYQTLRTTMRF